MGTTLEGEGREERVVSWTQEVGGGGVGEAKRLGQGRVDEH